MAKTNIKFYNKNYSIDEQSLATVTSALKSHLSTTMSGTGATISFGGTDYNIDSTKLSTATNNFITHLNTISGNGTEVVVNGTKYSVDSTKLSSAMSELSTAFDNLSGGATPDVPDVPTEERLEGDGAEYYTLAPTALSFRSTAPLNELQEIQINGVTVDPSNYTLEEGSTIVTFPIEYLKTLDVGSYEVTVASDSKTVKGDFSVAAPKLNEYGFYYNQPYTAYVTYFGENETVFIREGGVLDIIGTPSGQISQATYTISENNITVVSPIAGVLNGTISANGSEIFINELATSFRLTSDTSVVADNDYVYLLNEDGSSYYVKGAIDKTKASYSTIRTGINGLPTRWIDTGAFLQCENLTSITIPSCIEFILDNAFGACFNLDEVVIENCNVYIEGNPFPDSPLSKGVSTHHSYFKNDYVCDICRHCEHLHTDIVGKTDEYSGDVVCIDCGKTLTNGVHRIPNGATYYVSSTDKILYEGDWFPSVMQNGDKYTYGQYKYTLYKSGLISYWEFNVIDITLSEYDSWLEEINGVRVENHISDHAFAGCKSLASITIPNSVTSIDSYAFDGCKSLASITIPNSVTSIHVGAFSGCSSLTSITIPNSVTSIGGSVFTGCTYLTCIIFDGTITQWNAINKMPNWDYMVPATYVQCSDGQVAL